MTKLGRAGLAGLAAGAAKKATRRAAKDSALTTSANDKARQGRARRARCRSGQEGHRKSCQRRQQTQRDRWQPEAKVHHPSRLGQLHQQTDAPSVVRHARCRPSPDNGIVDGRKASDAEVMAMTEAMVTFKEVLQMTGRS
jgi:hypothetical protein